MGEHQLPNLIDLEKWLISRYGTTLPRDLSHIYSDEYKSQYKPRFLTADYVQKINDKMVYADIVGPNDEWRGMIGKIVCFAYEAEHNGKDYEIWLVTDFDADMKTKETTGEERLKHVKGWMAYFRERLRIVHKTMKPEISQRVKILYLDKEADVLQEVTREDNEKLEQTRGNDKCGK